VRGRAVRGHRQRQVRTEVELARELLGVLDGRFWRLGICDAIIPLETLERAYIRVVLALCNGNQSRAARLLGIGRNTLLRRGLRLI